MKSALCCHKASIAKAICRVHAAELPVRALAAGARVLREGYPLPGLVQPPHVGAAPGRPRPVGPSVAGVVLAVGAAVAGALHGVAARHVGALHAPAVHLAKQTFANLALVDPALPVGELDGCLLMLAEAGPVTLRAALQVRPRV